MAFEVYYNLTVEGDTYGWPEYRAIQRCTYRSFNEMRKGIVLMDQADFNVVSINLIRASEIRPDYYEDNYHGQT